MSPVRNSTGNLELLSQLLLSATASAAQTAPGTDGGELAFNYPGRTLDAIYRLSIEELEELRALANSNHVLVRSFEPLRKALAGTGRSGEARFATEVLENENARIQNALGFLHEICATLEECGCPVTVIKSLDHWPDLGSDLDLYTGVDPYRIIELLKSRFSASLADRSWGDRLANKWNFVVPGLPELIELHAGRLGQTGEQTAVTVSLAARSRWAEVGGCKFRIAAPEDRFVISTLQRMYRHFYIRLCDIVDNAALLDARALDFDYLYMIGDRAGLWEGVASYLAIISQYVEAYRGSGLPLPSRVTQSARMGISEVAFRSQFLRIPIVPHSVVLYASELKSLLFRGEIRNSLRLSLMPGLATAAVFEQKITGNDKGIW